jgi:hypothetical protein
MNRKRKIIMIPAGEMASLIALAVQTIPISQKSQPCRHHHARLSRRISCKKVARRSEQLNLALGASFLAKEHHAIVSSFPALQDIARVSMPCSDKTGTLTMPNMPIISKRFSMSDVVTSRVHSPSNVGTGRSLIVTLGT